MRILQLLQGKTTEERLKILYRIKEKLHLRLNEEGAKLRAGTVSEKDFRTFKTEVFRPRLEKVNNFINTIRQQNNMFAYGNRGGESATDPKYIQLVSIRDQGKVDSSIDSSINLEDL